MIIYGFLYYYVFLNFFIYTMLIIVKFIVFSLRNNIHCLTFWYFIFIILRFKYILVNFWNGIVIYIVKGKEIFVLNCDIYILVWGIKYYRWEILLYIHWKLKLLLKIVILKWFRVVLKLKEN